MTKVPDSGITSSNFDSSSGSDEGKPIIMNASAKKGEMSFR